MNKITNTSTKRKKVPKSDKVAIKPFREEYYTDLFSFAITPVSQSYLLKFALEWVSWASDNEDALTMTQYLNLKRLHQKTIDRWALRCPELTQAHEMVLQIIGDRRERGAITRKFDAAVVLKSMAMYNAKWREIEEWRATMSAKVAAAGGGIQVVELERYADSPLVPHKKV